MSATTSAGPSAATIAAVTEHARLLSIYSMMSTTAAGSGIPTSCMSAAELVAGVYFLRHEVRSQERELQR